MNHEMVVCYSILYEECGVYISIVFCLIYLILTHIVVFWVILDDKIDMETNCDSHLKWLNIICTNID